MHFEKPSNGQHLAKTDVKNTFIQTDNSHSEKEKKVSHCKYFLYCVKFCDEELRLTMLPLTIDKSVFLSFTVNYSQPAK